MEADPEGNRTAPPNSIEGPSSSTSQSQVHENAGDGERGTDRLQQVENHRRRRRPPGASYRINITVSDGNSRRMSEDVCSCLIVLVAFWFFASMTMILGFYGAVNLQLGPNCSRIMQVNPFFVQSIKVEEIDDSQHGPELYGFYDPPPLDTEILWSETHNALIQSSFHKEWAYFLNKGSEVNISYSVKSPGSIPLSLIIAQGRESLVEWIEDPSYPNITLSWNIIQGNGVIRQEMLRSYMYYIAVGNLNSGEVEVQLNFTIKGILYNTTNAYYKCPLSHRLCRFKLFLLGANVALLTSPAIPQGLPYYDWYVKLSYGPRWAAYIAGSGIMTAIVLLAFRICGMFQTVGEIIERGTQARNVIAERAPLLSHKDDDLSSWGSSYDSISHDEEESDEWLAVASLHGKPIKEGESNSNPNRLCVLCFDAARDCFFLPCGHCAVCFTCGTRILEEGGTCPICHRTMKKVRKIFTV